MHPENRKVRNLVAGKKGLKRSEAIVGTSWPRTKEERTKQVIWLARHHRDTTKLCSRFCCGNPRKFYGEKTRQEYESDVRFQQELREEEKEREIGM